MKGKMRGILTLMIFFSLCIILMPSAEAASPASGTWGSNISWTLDSSGLLTISGSGDMGNFSSYTSTDAWRAYKSEIRSVVIEEGITSLGSYAFRSCSELVEVSIPNSVTRIATSVFDDCWDLKEVTLPENLVSIGRDAFSFCYSLTDITIPGSVTTIGSFAFSYCKYLKSATLLDGVKNIDSYAFSNCDALEEIIIPDSITTIGNSAFNNCSGLQSALYKGSPAQWEKVTVNSGNDLFLAALHFEVDNVSSIELDYTSLVLDQGTNQTLKATVYPSTASTVMSWSSTYSYVASVSEDGTVTANHPGTTEIVVTDVSGAVEARCTVTVVVPASDITLSASTLRLAEGSSSAITATVSPYNVTDKTVLWSSSDPEVATVSENGTVQALKPGSATITATTKSGGKTASCEVTVYYAVQSIILSTSHMVLDINESQLLQFAVVPAEAFADADLTLITYDTRIATIDGSARVYGNGPGTTTIMVKAGNGVCASCTVSVREIFQCGDSAYAAYCDGVLSIEGSGAMYNYAETGNIPPWRSRTVHTIQVGDAITDIGSYAFYGLDATSVTLPDHIPTLRTSCFENCRYLRSVDLPADLYSISTYAFKGCTSLETVTFHDHVQEIGMEAFENCSNLRELVFPPSLTTIRRYAFNYCSALNSITFTGNMPEILKNADGQKIAFSGVTANVYYPAGNSTYTSAKRIGYGGNLTWIKCYVISYNANGGSEAPSAQPKYTGQTLILTTAVPQRSGCYFVGWAESANATIPKYLPGGSFTKDANTALYAVWAIPDLVPPAGLTAIGAEAFEGGAFTCVKIPDNTESIGPRAFANCPNLRYICIPEVTTIDSTAFENTSQLTILGKSGSVAQSYALSNGISFIMIP